MLTASRFLLPSVAALSVTSFVLPAPAVVGPGAPASIENLTDLHLFERIQKRQYESFVRSQLNEVEETFDSLEALNHGLTGNVPRLRALEADKARLEKELIALRFSGNREYPFQKEYVKGSLQELIEECDDLVSDLEKRGTLTQDLSCSETGQ